MDLLMRFLEFTAKEMSPPKAYRSEERRVGKECRL